MEKVTNTLGAARDEILNRIINPTYDVLAATANSFVEAIEKLPIMETFLLGTVLYLTVGPKENTDLIAVLASLAATGVFMQRLAENDSFSKAPNQPKDLETTDHTRHLIP